MNTIIYCRKSRGTQEELQNQIEICLSYCRSKEYEISEIFSEVKSSQDFSREYYCKMLEYIKDHSNVRVVCVDLSRLNRNVVAQIKLNELIVKHNSIIETVNNGIIKTDSPENKMLNNIIANFDEFYYNVTKQKMHKGLMEARKRGIRIGAKLYGYEIENKRLVIDPSKADTVKRVFKLIAEGYSTKQVVEILKKENITTNTGRFFDTRAIRLMVQNEGYTGQKKGNTYPPIIDRELFLLANQQLKSLPNNGGKRSYPLSSKIKCGHCGNTMVIGVKNDRPQPVLSKGMSKTCKCMSHRYDYIESIVKSDCLAYIESKLDGLYQKLTDDKAVLAEHQKELDGVQTEIDTNKEKLTRLNKLFLLGNVSEQELQEYSKEYKDSIVLLSEKQKRLESYSLYKVAQELQDKIIRLEEMQSSADINELVQLVDHVDYWKDTTGLSVVTVFKE